MSIGGFKKFANPHIVVDFIEIPATPFSDLKMRPKPSIFSVGKNEQKNVSLPRVSNFFRWFPFLDPKNDPKNDPENECTENVSFFKEKTQKKPESQKDQGRVSIGRCKIQNNLVPLDDSLKSPPRTLTTIPPQPFPLPGQLLYFLPSHLPCQDNCCTSSPATSPATGLL